MAALPRPATIADEYLFDIATSLRQLTEEVARLAAAVQPQVDAAGEPDVINLREPELAQPARKKK